ncbi:aldehyde dehydrogenase [Mycolicibacterium insubricum]|uniref:Aldehyde dehydrogenase n=1 Tax=Mycolicibacterium insubricum TaxID=444597 RepID=A0A1X0DJK0_9MYCO|nr:aldehyde dehydrogenase family protein [Mycolicibacterium insubricum]MCV7081542.1 aldehyde dehydrogenase [Mycolicibacterium insubricum]ORA72583.1 aldehyde dehydrogenase [Mycolicibacterium insubricum]BBZ66803.1 aldehyde dehydrogenase [Mycolicibacterium insubricum]
MTAAPHYQMYINGSWHDTGESIGVYSPATGELVATVAHGDLSTVDTAVAAARAAHDIGVWRGMSPQRRADFLDAIADNLASRAGELGKLQVHENGATIRGAQAFLIGYSISHLRYFAQLARDYAFQSSGPLAEAPTLAAGLIVKDPIGVCAGIIPWNFPLLLAVWKLGPALAAGNTVVLKPDDQTPLTLLELARAADEVGLPAGVLNVVTGPGPVVGARLAEHRDVRKIAFTGSTEVGRAVMTAAADTVKRVTLELGGKGANIVLDDADLDLAVDGTLFGFLLMSGQACESGTRLLVPESLRDEFVRRLVARARTLTVGDPMDPTTDLGPLISAEGRARVEKYIALGQEEGCTIAFQGAIPSDPALAEGHWVGPTILTGATNHMRVAREEIFGPVLVVLTYRDDDEAVAIANDSEYGLSAGIWSADAARALALARRLESGTVWINDWHMINAMYPFGGVKQSGLGRELGPDALDEYTEPKFIHLDLTNDRSKRAYPVVISAAP